MKDPNVYKRVHLGEEGNKYVASCLDDGRSLSRSLRSRFDIGGGDAFCYLPQPPSVVGPELFRNGGVSGGQISSGIAEAVLKVFISSPFEALIGENALAECTDQYISSNPEGVLCYRSEVYHVGFWDGAGSLSIRRALQRTRTAASREVLALGKAIEPFGNWPRRVDDIEPFAEAAKAILVGAFDGEGYVIWMPQFADLLPGSI